MRNPSPCKPDPIDTEEFKQALAAELRVRRERSGVRQSALLAPLGMKQNALSERFNGKTEWRPNELIDLCDCLGVDLGEVLGAAKRVARERMAESAAAPAVAETPAAEEQSKPAPAARRVTTDRTKRKPEGGSRADVG